MGRFGRCSSPSILPPSDEGRPERCQDQRGAYGIQRGKSRLQQPVFGTYNKYPIANREYEVREHI